MLTCAVEAYNARRPDLEMLAIVNVDDADTDWKLVMEKTKILARNRSRRELKVSNIARR